MSRAPEEADPLGHAGVLRRAALAREHADLVDHEAAHGGHGGHGARDARDARDAHDVRDGLEHLRECRCCRKGRHPSPQHLEKDTRYRRRPRRGLALRS